MKELLIENFWEYKTWDSDRMSTIGKHLLENIFIMDKSVSKIAVKVLKTDDNGVVKGAELYIYDSYINALEQINNNEFDKNIAVEVFEINYHGYAHIMYKAFDGICYIRYAHPKFHKYELSTVRYLYDTNMLVFKCFLEANE